MGHRYLPQAPLLEPQKQGLLLGGGQVPEIDGNTRLPGPGTPTEDDGSGVCSFKELADILDLTAALPSVVDHEKSTLDKLRK